MKVKSFEWEGARATATRIRGWTSQLSEPPDLEPIFREVISTGDRAVVELTNRFDATKTPLATVSVDPLDAQAALTGLDGGLREALELAAANVREVAEAQLGPAATEVTPAAGQKVTVREVALQSAGVYAPGGKAAYPSSVLMCAIPARVAGVERVALASPPGPDGRIGDEVLAAAALCGIDEIYAMGGAQAIFALAYGTETIDSVDAIVGPGNAWVRDAKKAVAGVVAIDSLAGPSELMVIAGHDTDPEWAALDLCAQAEHGEDSPLLVAAVEQHVLDSIEAATAGAAAARESVAEAPLALVQVPDAEAAVELANAYAPEHLELLEEDASLLAAKVRTAGCVFAGRHAATAFGDYVAGSNHVLPTGGAGRFSGPLGPGTFRRRIATVEVPSGSAAKLAPHVETIARAEGFPVHGESAMIRMEKEG